ncbi:hypothetical protein ASPWEDRAFT_39531 [Aspergillus wentii DTO 134E9]|uniref:F-box domain-containing protein n=1 Tax=Aspergillus wentii DTO 134E9 TaxID=1073089 RepID=A0A1L9RSE1_ASPWE|nr:uncharacterized protein ASPWEDRAFT_39531 [Aspergillus wentii DTO 134E9]OJJ37793.1 hypothetical protein ASPWEDRAFT_39531 [Aspergillus wentii DTO 134E9]
MPSKQPSLCQRIPTDCWMGVFDHLEADEIVTALAASRHLTASVRPSVYSRIAWEWNTVPRARILHLLRAVLQCPDLASNIQHVSILSSSEYAFDEKWQKDARFGQDEPFSDQDLQSFSDVVEQSQSIVDKGQFPEASKWNEALQNGNSYAYVTILLSQLHNLQSLRLDYSFVWQSGFPGLMLKHALFSAPKGVLPSFDSLTTIDYGSNVPLSEEFEPYLNSFDKLHGYPPCDPNQFMAWFHLPSIQSLSIWLRSFQDVITSEDQGNLSNLDTLVVARATIKEENVPALLSQMTTLRSLHLGMAYRWHSEFALESCSNILEGLESISGTLEKLSLGVEYYPFSSGHYNFGTDFDHQARIEFMFFLNHFPRLRSAEVPITLLIGLEPEDSNEIGERLPDTLEELCLQWDNAEIMSNDWEFESQLHDCVRYLLDDLQSHSPHLKRVTIRQRCESPKDKEWFAKDRAELKEMCTEAGIDLEVVWDYLSPGLWTQNDP